MSLPMKSPLARILRIALGAVLFAVLLIVLGSTGASAAPGHTGKAPDKGLVSGILDPVTDLLDQTLQQVPVVNDVTGSNTVGNLVAPVTGTTDQVESGLETVPVVKQVLAPVGGVTNAVVPPVVQVVGSTVTPAVGAVAQVTAPVVSVTAPILDPVAGTVKPIVDDVTGGVADVVDTVVAPVVPPVVPGMPGGTVDVPDSSIPVEIPGVQLPVVVEADQLNEAVAPVAPSANVVNVVDVAAEAALDSAEAAPSGAEQQDAAASAQSLGRGALSRYLEASALPEFSSSAAMSAEQTSAATGPATVVDWCESNGNGDVIGPCAPGFTASAASGSSLSLTSSASGSFLATSDHFWNYLHNAGDTGQPLAADWPLPASMPENPGSTPG